MYTNFITEWSTICNQVGDIAVQQLVRDFANRELIFEGQSPKWIFNLLCAFLKPSLIHFFSLF